MQWLRTFSKSRKINVYNSATKSLKRCKIKLSRQGVPGICNTLAEKVRSSISYCAFLVKFIRVSTKCGTGVKLKKRHSYQCQLNQIPLCSTILGQSIQFAQLLFVDKTAKIYELTFVECFVGGRPLEETIHWFLCMMWTWKCFFRFFARQNRALPHSIAVWRCFRVLLRHGPGPIRDNGQYAVHHENHAAAVRRTYKSLPTFFTEQRRLR